MDPALAIVEFNSIASGIRAGDAMMKKAPVTLLGAHTICPGKYLVIIGGLTAPVEESLRAGIEAGGEDVVDTLFLPQVHPGVFPALTGTARPVDMEALGVIETITAATCILSADAAAKAADVTLSEIRLANGLGGKGFVLIQGDVSNVEAAVEAGVRLAKGAGLLVRSVVIPRLHESLRDRVLW